MNKQFMQEYYEGMYEDIAGEVVKDNREHQNLMEKYLSRCKIFDKKLADLDKILYDEYEELQNLFDNMNRIVYKELYIKGAEDREKMLM